MSGSGRMTTGTTPALLGSIDKKKNKSNKNNKLSKLSMSVSCASCSKSLSTTAQVESHDCSSK